VGSRLSIYHPQPSLALKANPFGKDVANLELFQALARHGGFEQVDILGLRPGNADDLSRALFAGQPASARVTAGSILHQQMAADSGALFRGQPDLYDLAWLRRRAVGDRAYSLLGLVHTLGPPFMRQLTAMASVAPIQPWDAIVCTSPSVQEALTRMFDAWGGYLAERMAGAAPPRPALPIVPLGVDGPRFAAAADRPDARQAVRARLGLADADVLVIWVGRLSFFEKAFPQAMFQAVRRAAEATGVRAHFAMAGWFPNESDRALYEASAARHAAGVDLHFLDGNDRELLGELWAGADIFISLVDNIQETFGITPLEAMAAGLPVVVSDWDGYRFTVRDGVEGFLVPTLGGPTTGLGHNMAQRHIVGAASYQAYVGEVAQYTAVHVGRAAEAIAQLIASPELRRTMGAAGRERVRTAFDWPVVARQVRALTDELDAVRRAAPDPVTRFRADPVRGDPFVDFAGFASQVLTLDMPLRAAAGATGADVLAIPDGLDRAFLGLRADLSECARALDLLAAGEARTPREVLTAFPVDRRRLVETGLAWMAKLGLIDWLD
jgi:glycosyltransferase involved in cell wall biosynthesis